MNILVFGKDGQLGKAFAEQLQGGPFSQGNMIRFVGRSDCDLAKPEQLQALLESFHPQVIINAAAYTAVDKAESETELAFAINAVAPEIMAQYAAAHNATLLHFSTDYVFDGSGQQAYTESDQTNPLGIYGKSKAAGEQAITKAFANHAQSQYAILRTSWVYGNGGNFIRTILRLAKERSELRVIDDQFGVPTSAQWLAELGTHLVLSKGDQSFISGVYHAVPGGETSWHGLAQLAVQTALEAGQALQVTASAIEPIPASQYPLPAPRPMNSRLANNKLALEIARLGLVSKLPHWNTPWDEQVRTYVKQLVSANK